MLSSPNLLKTATTVVQTLKHQRQQLVLAESCTAGLVASTIAGIPGASSVLVGSAVVYQVATKQQWLKICAKHFEEFDVVSSETSRAMAQGILEQTPWATVAASITGHLGPEAPVELDGIAWATVALKQDTAETILQSQKLCLDQSETRNKSPLQLRQIRQVEAANQLMRLIVDVLTAH